MRYGELIQLCFDEAMYCLSICLTSADCEKLKKDWNYTMQVINREMWGKRAVR